MGISTTISSADGMPRYPGQTLSGPEGEKRLLAGRIPANGGCTIEKGEAFRQLDFVPPERTAPEKLVSAAPNVVSFFLACTHRGLLSHKKDRDPEQDCLPPGERHGKGGKFQFADSPGKSNRSRRLPERPMDGGVGRTTPAPGTDGKECEP